MKTVKILGFLVLFSTLPVYAEDVTNFSIRGISPGMNPADSCISIAGDFPAERELKKKLSQDGKVDNWFVSVKGHISSETIHAKGCGGSYQTYDKSIGGAMVKSDNINIRAENGLVVGVKNSQVLAVGKTMHDCQKQRENIIDGLTKQYGKPSFTHEKSTKKDYRHLIWDYSSKPSARFGDDEYELYQFYAECSMYTHDAEFSQMTLKTELHSGVVRQKSRSQVEIKNTYKPRL